uniref:tyrosine-type recombinase/integrase n=1 Tax=Symbiobacterium terraclitae TaxID=557451 RepID=UPI0035B558BB
MKSWQEWISEWSQELDENTGLAARTISAYVNDARVWARWAARHGIHSPDLVTARDVKQYRDAREDGAGKAPATVNRRLVSLSLLLEFCGRKGEDNPASAKRVAHLDDSCWDDTGRALDRLEWLSVRRIAERDGSLALALVSLLRYAGLRVGEVAPVSTTDKPPLVLGDLTILPRSGEVRIRAAKGNKSRTVPLTLEAREALKDYIWGEREERVNRWAERKGWSEDTRLWWLGPEAPVFLGERGPLTVRGLRHIIAQIGERAKLDYILGPHDFRATFANALLDPQKYGINREPTPITVVARLMGHRSVE